MSDRKSGESFKSYVERQIREARERGEFHVLEGKGERIEELYQPYEPDWWIKQKMRREKFSFVPDAIAIRRECEAFRQSLPRIASEQEVRTRTAELNERIRKINRTVTHGPPTTQAVMDVDEVVRRWRLARQLG